MNLSTYFDAAASTPLDPQVKAAMLDRMDIFGNNNSKHKAGFEAQRVIDESLKVIANVLNCNWEQLSVMYSGTDANRRIIRACEKSFGLKNMFCSAVEHSSVSDEIPSENRFDPQTLEGLRGNPSFIALMGANSETGNIYDGAVLRKKFPKSFILRDYSQSFAKGVLPDLENCDAGVFTPQKFYGPKHIGILYLKNPEAFPEISKDTHTKSCFLVAGAAKAFEVWSLEREEVIKKMRDFENIIIDFIRQNIPDYKFHGIDHPKVPGVLSVAFQGVRGGELMSVLSQEESICVSIGSACTSDIMVPTEVIKFMEPDPKWQYPIRISLHKFLEVSDVYDFCEVLAHYVEELRK